jgi:hypothetical protein
MITFRGPGSEPNQLRGTNLSDWASAKKHGMHAQMLVVTCQRTLVPVRAAVHLQQVHCLHMLYLSCHIHKWDFNWI